MNIPSEPADVAYAAAALTSRLYGLDGEDDVVHAMCSMCEDQKWITDLWYHPEHSFLAWVSSVMPEMDGLVDIDVPNKAVKIADGLVTIKIPQAVLDAGAKIVNLDYVSLSALLADEAGAHA